MLGYACFFALIWNVYSAHAPFIKPCKDGDSTCVLESSIAAKEYFAAGIKELGINTLDPLKIAVINSDQGGLKLKFTDSTLTGLKNCKFDSIKHDIKKGKQSLLMTCNLFLTGDYKLDGQLLIFKVQGNGKYSIDLRDIQIKVVHDFITVQGKDGKPHWKITSWKDSFQVKTGVTFKFDNLFNGNKVLADPIIEFVNTNWKDVMQEIAPPIVHSIVAEVINDFEAFHEAVPSDELYIP